MNKYQLLHVSSYLPIIVRCTTDSWGLTLCWISYIWFSWLAEAQRDWNGYEKPVWVRMQRENEIAVVVALFLHRYIPSMILLPCIALIMFFLRRIPADIIMRPLVISSSAFVMLSGNLVQSLGVFCSAMSHFIKYPSRIVSDKEIFIYIAKRAIQIFVIGTSDLLFMNRIFVLLLCIVWKLTLLSLPSEDGEWDIDIETDVVLDLGRKEVYKAHEF